MSRKCRAGGGRSRRSPRRSEQVLAIALGCLSLLPAGATAAVTGNRASSAAASLKFKVTCVKAGTSAPKVLGGGPWLNHPGDRKSQTFTAEAEYRPLPAECEGAFRRTPSIKFQVQSPTSHSHWSDAGGYLAPRKSDNVQKEELEQLEEEREEHGKSCWMPIPGGEKNICRINPHITDSGGVGEVYFHPPWKLHEPSYSRHDPRLYRCTPGKSVTHVRALVKSTVTSVGTGKVAGQRVVVVPVQVRRYPGKGPMPKAWRGAVRGPC
jgi:hypothetical protein